jgi:hypothetical protein
MTRSNHRADLHRLHAPDLHGYMPAPEVVMPDEETPREFPPPGTRPNVAIAEIVARIEGMLGKIGSISIRRSGEQLRIRDQKITGRAAPAY